MAKKEEKAKKLAETSGSYTAKDIYVLEGLEPVRKLPGMYIGSTGLDGLHHLVWEVMDNSIDEAMGGFAKNITIELLPDNQVSVTDDGRGIPVEVHHQTKKSTLETVLTTLHAGGKFGGESYKVSGGLHGVGVSVVNALSEWLRVEVCRDSELWMQEYERGEPKSKVKKIGKCERTGTKVIFSPDPKIFSEIVFSDKRILDHIRQQSYLTKGIRINFLDKRKSPFSFYGFYFEGGVLSFVKYLAASEKLIQDEIFYIHKESEGSEKEKMEIEVAFAYMDDFSAKELSFANNIYTPDGGMHLTGFRSALTRTLNNYARSENYLKEKEENLTADDVREGLVTVISVRLREPQFEGQTKARLGNPEAKTAVEAVVNEALKEFLEKRPSEARKMIEKVLLAAKARLAAKAAKDTVLRKGAFDGLTLPGKLADCSSKNPEESEIFIVEGDSAGGCFSGDTKIALTDGRNINFRELVEEDKKGIKNYCYTVDGNRSIKIAEILNPRLTKKNAPIIKIILDNDEEIICTPDHKFMLAEGIYKEAQNLNTADSLMPLYRKFSEIGGKITISGYEMIRERRLSAYNATYCQKAIKTLRGIYEQKGNLDIQEYEKTRRDTNDKSLLRYDTILERFFNGDQCRLREAVINFNHKIKKIIKLDETIDVYDLEVPGTHNFALASGVFVHNSAKAGRDRRTQAILPVKGKILNVEKARLDKMLANQEIRSLVVAMGTAIGDNFDLSKLRYHKIVLMSDADVDGAHIRTLFLTLFYRYFPQIIEGGYLYIAQPPLYRMQSGKNVRYAFSDAEKDKTILEMQKLKEQKAGIKGQVSRVKTKGEVNEEEIVQEVEGESLDEKKIPGIAIQRYKGLGEMNPEQLWETTMNPEKRVLRLVEVGDAEKADKLFGILMGDLVEPRKQFIQAYAAEVQNLDI